MSFTSSKTPAPEAVSQMSSSEVERLLSLVGGPEAAVIEPGSSGGQPGQSGDLHSRHDFPQVSSFSGEEMRKLRARCDAFVNSLAARLSVHLGLECSLQITKLETLRFRPFLGALPNPTHLTLFRLDPLAGICLLDIPSPLAFTIVDRELGGPGVCQDEVRDLTQIESKLAAKVVLLMLEEWCQTWADTLQIRPALIRHESSGRHLQTSAPEAMVLSLSLETHIAQTVEQIQLALPRTVLEPLIHKLNSDLRRVEKPETAPAASAELHWNTGLNDVPIVVSARWRGMELTARQLLELKLGDVVPLRAATTSQVELSLDATPKFAGQLGTSGRHLAIQIVEAI